MKIQSVFFEGQVGELIWLKALSIKTCYLDKWDTPVFASKNGSKDWTTAKLKFGLLTTDHW